MGILDSRGWIRNRLDLLDWRRRALFAAACAERLVSAWEVSRQGQDLQGVRAELDELWEMLAGADVPGNPEQRRRLLRAKLPQSECEDPSPNWVDALSVTAYALDAALGADAGSAAWAASCVSDALEAWADRGVGEFSGPLGIVAQELDRQQRDLEEIGRTETIDTALLRLLRMRARGEGQALLLG